MYRFEDIFSNPLPRFVYDFLLSELEAGGPSAAADKVLALRAIGAGDIDAACEQARLVWSQGHQNLNSVATVFQAAYRVFPASHVLPMVRPVMASFENDDPNRVQIARMESALTRGVQEVRSVLKKNSDRFLPKQVVMLDQHAAAQNGIQTVDIEALPFETYSSPTQQIDADPLVDLSRVQRHVTAWESRTAVASSSLEVYQPSNCILTALRATPMIEQGQTLAALSPCIEHFHHARWVGVTLSHSSISHRYGPSIVLPRSGPGYYYHQVMDHLASILMFEETSIQYERILVPDDMSKFDELLAALDIQTDRIIRYDDSTSVQIQSPTIVPLAHASKAKVSHARRRISTLDRPEGTGRKVYVSRRKAKARPLLNEPEVIDIVTDAGYEVAYLEEMPVLAQAKLFRSASSIIAPHGGGLTNLIFSYGQPRVLELAAESYLVDFFFRLCQLCGLPYSLYVGSAANERDPSAWKIDTDRFRSALQRFESGDDLSPPCAHEPATGRDR